MSLTRYSLICLVCGLLITVTGCTKEPVQVVNTTSGIVIHRSDFTGNTSTRTSSARVRYEQTGTPTEKSTGAVIRLGDSYQSLDLGPVF